MTPLFLTKNLNFRQKYSSLTPFPSQFERCLASHNSTSQNIGGRMHALAVPHFKFGGPSPIPPKSPPMTKPTTQTLYCLHLKIYYITTSLFGKCGKFWSVQISNARSRPIAVISASRSAYRGLDHTNHLSVYLSITPSEIIISGLLKRMVIYCFDLSLGEYLMRDSCCHWSVFP